MDEMTNETMEMEVTTAAVEVDTEKHERFKAESKERMSKLCAQIAMLEKIAAKRSVDYTR